VGDEGGRGLAPSPLGSTQLPLPLPSSRATAGRPTVERWRWDAEDTRAAASPPPRARLSPPRPPPPPPSDDGRTFFKAARSAIAPHRYDALLAAVRALNAGETGAAGAVAAAGAALGAEGAHLLPEFEGLLARHL